MARGTKMREIKERLERTRKEISDLEGRLAVLRGQETLLLELTGGAIPVSTARPGSRAPRSNVKQEVIDLLRIVKASGLNATMAVEMAKTEHNVEIGRGTVSSLLSRMKNDGIVTYIGGLYRLKEHSEDVPSGDKPSATVHPLRASGEAP